MHSLLISDSIKVIGRAGAGVNNIPVAAMTQRGIFDFLNTPGANANAVRELVIAGCCLQVVTLHAWNYIDKLQSSSLK